ncbi:beta-lactamase domain protein [Desulfofarcimen acetoxidans DSM 771]|jgi:7,8-dihydropterin-6-yl-methyl-4-(beta-D-ribofuranosyl)aminobenzene 5'-phosphate synthase|uniref:Beta-lactamase domain protein n=1 Tax=Desulfofarcimen acetoxidans (strain ATCC 49208 / DSM 771 / KCTC 5769 / VKM B-1644 / 5575) TaxID=485916 RepID=C8VX28_DESAS|nr:MBL fold metallo-hydrolase [Desulfofarcimen acetoxidans]ACV62604.1 beta-lactamase domain protein [Desulfofarcimen acetoxidans DSM 771]
MLTLTTLSENSANRKGLLAEHGLSILVEYGKYRLLFDTGQSISCLHNAEKLGINLQDINEIALSHGHFDHTGGLKHILAKGPKKVYTHPDSLLAKYRKLENNEYKPMGLPCAVEELEALGANFIFNRQPVEICPGLLLTGEIPRNVNFEPTASGHVILEGNEYRRDFLLDDQALVIKTSSGTVVLLGCSHSGIINTLNYARVLTNSERIHAVIGGTHLIEANSERLELTINALKAMRIEKIAVSHCTGFKAQMALKQAFGDHFILNNCGHSIHIN